MNGRDPQASVTGTIARGVRVLRFVAERGRTTIRETSAAMSLAPSTVHRLFDLLAREDMIEHDRVERSYRIGPEFYRISARVVSGYDIRLLALPFLRRIVDRCNETCVLGIYLPAMGKMVFAEKIDSQQLLRYQIPMNAQETMIWGASGRVMLAYLPVEHVDRIYAQEAAETTGRRPPPVRAVLDRALAEIRSQGFAVTHGQNIPGAVGIHAPVFGADGGLIGSLGLTVPESRIAPGDERRLGAMLMGEAAALSNTLGAPTALKRRAELQA